ncbi:MAG TPA: PAS domain-containing protein [Dongiaceae bacterium]
MDDLGGIRLIQASELSSGIVRAAVEYWRSKRAGEAPPDRDSFDPLEVPRLLPNLV